MKKSLFSLFNRPSFHNPIVDGVRGLGLIMVVFGHLLHFHDPLFTNYIETRIISDFFYLFRADLAVDAFFVISGFLIGSILLNEYKKNSFISFKGFYLRRFLRLMPVYFAAIILGLVFLYFIKEGIGADSSLSILKKNELVAQIEGMMSSFWANLLYINNFIPIQEQFMGWCWSLAVEEQFYIIIPLFLTLLLFFKKRPSYILYVFFFLLVLACFIRFFIVYHFDLVGEGFWGEFSSDSWRNTFNLLYDNLYTRYGGLLIGVMASYVCVYCLEDLKLFFNKIKLCKSLYFFSLLVFVCVFFKVDYIYFCSWSDKEMLQITASKLSGFEKIYFSFVVAISRNLFSLSVMYIILYLMFTDHGSKSFLNRVMSSKFLFPVAQLSYSAYLIHPIVMIPVCRYCTNFFFENGVNSVFVVFIINSFVSVILIFFLSLLLYLFIEKPCMEIRSTKYFLRLVKK